MNNQVKIFVLVVFLLVVGTVATAVLRGGVSTAPVAGVYDQFAQCLKDKGATFFGAFWCPHCQAQKKLFGTSVHLLPYVECSMPDGNSQTQICIDNKITGYPTWQFADGSRLSGEVALEKLAEKTSCTLPADVTATAPVDTGASSSATPVQ